MPIYNVEPYKLIEIGLSLVPEGRRLFVEMTVEENLDMGSLRLMLFDEPSLGLAPREIFDVIKMIRSEGTTVLVVEQNTKQTLTILDRAYVLETGRITPMELVRPFLITNM